MSERSSEETGGSHAPSAPWSRQLRQGRTATSSSRSSTDDSILVGEVVKPHGIRGDVIVEAYSENPERFSEGARFATENRTLVVSSVRGSSRGSAGPRLIVGFEGVTDREGAEALRGIQLFVKSQELSELESGWWEHQVVGMEVVDPSGNSIGHVKSVVQGEHQDLWVIESEHSSFMLPAVEEIVKSVDRDAMRIVAKVPEGLIEES